MSRGTNRALFFSAREMKWSVFVDRAAGFILSDTVERQRRPVVVVVAVNVGVERRPERISDLERVEVEPCDSAAVPFDEHGVRMRCELSRIGDVRVLVVE